MELQDYRAQLDQIDDQIVSLFTQRMETVRNVADYKKAGSETSSIGSPARAGRNCRNTPGSSSLPCWS